MMRFFKVHTMRITLSEYGNEVSNMQIVEPHYTLRCIQYNLTHPRQISGYMKQSNFCNWILAIAGGELSGLDMPEADPRTGRMGFHARKAYKIFSEPISSLNHTHFV